METTAVPFEWFAEGDGCSLWFDTWRGIDLTPCCEVHDAAFALGTTLEQFIDANIGLFACGVSAGAWDWAVLALIGVCSPIGAWLFFRGKKRTAED